MKIGIEAQRLFRKTKHGMDIVALELIKSLQEVDDVNEYFIFAKPDKDENVVIKNDNFHIIRLNGGPYPIWEQVILPKAIKQYDLDLLHCTANTAPLYTNLPLVLTLHDVIFLENINLTKGTWYQRMGNLYRRWNVPKIVGNCKAIATVSDYEQKNISKRLKLPKGILYTLYNGVGSHFKIIDNNRQLLDIKEKYLLPNHFIFAFGSHDPRKNTYNILKSYSLLVQNGYKIHLFMPDMNRGYLKRILSDIDHPKLADLIVTSEYIPNDDLPSIYNLATIFVFPSTRESFGIPVLEAMACGTPVVTSNISSMPEISGDAAVLTDPHSPASIYLGIAGLLDNKCSYKEYQEKGLQRVKKFSWRQTALNCLKLYNQVARA